MVLVLSMEQAGGLSAAMNAAILFPGFKEFLLSRGISEAYQKFRDDFSDKYHEHGWCMDPSCPDNKKV